MRKPIQARVRALVPVAALALCACFGTEQGTDPATQSKWTGLLLRSCGPADGPAVDFRIDTVPMACDAPGDGVFRAQVGGALDTLKPVLSIQEWGDVACDGTGDPVGETSTLTLTRKDSVSATVHFIRVRTHPCAANPPKPDTLQGDAELKVCRDRPAPLCG